LIGLFFDILTIQVPASMSLFQYLSKLQTTLSQRVDQCRP